MSYRLRHTTHTRARAVLPLLIGLLLASGCAPFLQESIQAPVIDHARVSHARTPEEAIQALVAAQSNVLPSDVTIYQTEIQQRTAILFHKAFGKPNRQTGLPGLALVCVSRVYLTKMGWTHDSNQESNCLLETLPAQRGVQCAFSEAHDLQGTIIFGRIDDATLNAIEVTVNSKTVVRIDRMKQYFLLYVTDNLDMSIATTTIHLHYEHDALIVTDNIAHVCPYVTSLPNRR